MFRGCMNRFNLKEWRLPASMKGFMLRPSWKTKNIKKDKCICQTSNIKTDGKNVYSNVISKVKRSFIMRRVLFCYFRKPYIIVSWPFILHCMHHMDFSKILLGNLNRSTRNLMFEQHHFLKVFLRYRPTS